MEIDKNTKTQARSELIDIAERLLQGPLDTDEAILSSPLDTYLTGILWPQGSDFMEEDDDGVESGLDDDTHREPGVPGYRIKRPCSIGITFAVKPNATIDISLGKTARYRFVRENNDDAPDEKELAKVASDKEQTKAQQKNDDVSSNRFWRREELGFSLHIPASQSAGSSKFNQFTDIDGNAITDRGLSLHVRRRVMNELHVITVTLINELTEDTADDDDLAFGEKALLQSEVIVKASSEGRPAIVPRPTPTPDPSDKESLVNSLLYRDIEEYAVGHGVAATWEEDSSKNIAQVRTSWIPISVVHSTSSDGHMILRDFRKSWPDALSAIFLSNESDKESVIDALTAFSEKYSEWIDEELRQRLQDFDGHLKLAAEQNLDKCLVTLKRIKKGVKTLTDSEDAWLAFTLANQAMNKQSMFQARGSDAKPLVWRPFQLAFMLLVIPGLVYPDLEERECMDLLWFPTGGGKTEAYLAITAFYIFYKRLSSSQRRESGGVDVLMRYTLRLLTVQQFQRATALVTACELIRTKEPRLGSSRISIGLYVGADASPNRMDKAREAINQELDNQKPRSTPRQLLRCPVCGSELLANAYHVSHDAPRIDITCQYDSCETKGAPLPVLTVDDTIYAEPPSLLIGTVDKFAQIPRSTEIRSIFGLNGGAPPGLIIQDELHLISGPLGSIAGMYETVVDTLCTHNNVRPKIIGSTATIGHAEEQVRSLFDRSVLQFPPSGFDASDSFFAVRDYSGPDRIYLGLSSAGRSPKFSLQAIVASLLQSVFFLQTKGAESACIDPYWTCVSYFNSLRELGGAYVLMQDDVPRQMQFLATRLGIDTRKLEALPVELSSRQSSRDLPRLLHELAASLSKFDQDPFEHPEPKDTVLASNMISVGVDVSRLGLMVVNGQPKSTAEYIQASSRVGRGIPGLVVTLYNFARPRDLSHFEHFKTYHGALYRNVEATSVTPWAPRARDKALHAVIASLVRHLVPGLSNDEDAINFNDADPRVQEIISSIKSRVVSTTDDREAHETAEDIDAIVSEWKRRCQDVVGASRRFRYWKKKAPFGRTSPHLMCSAEDSDQSVGQAWRTPNTMRDVEASTAFVLKTIGKREKN